MSREVLEQTDNTKSYNNNEYDSIKIVDCKSNYLRNEILKRNIETQYIKTVKYICDKFENIGNKIGIFFILRDSLEIIFDTFEQFINIPSYIIYKKKQLLLLRSRGLSDEKINLLLKNNYIKDKYVTYKSLNLNTILFSRMLISIQTANPKYIKNVGVTSKCSFNGWGEIDGVFDYMSCILIEGKSIKFNNTIKTFENKMGIIKNDLKYHLNKFKNLGKIRKLYENVKNNIKNNIKTHIDTVIKSPELKKVDKLSDKFLDNLINTNSNNKKKILYNLLHARLKYINISIINAINLIISNSELLNGINTENSCCVSELDDYKSYDEYFKGSINDFKNESNKIGNYEIYFINVGNLTKLRCKNKNPIYNINYAIQCDSSNLKINIQKYKEKISNNIDLYDINTSNIMEKNKLLIKTIRDILNKDKKWVNDFSITLKKLGIWKCLNCTKNIDMDICMNNSDDVILKNLKKFYIDMIRYVNIIKNRFIKTDNISKIETVNETTSKILQEKIYNEYNFLNEYLDNKYNNTFKNLKTKYNITDISNIYGRNDVYNCKNIIMYKSKFNKKNAIILLRYIITDQLLYFYSNTPNNDIFSKKVISQFIIKIITVNDRYNNIFDIPYNDIELYREHIDYEFNNEYRIKIDSMSGASKTMIKNYFKVDNLDIFDSQEYEEYAEASISKEEKDVRDILTEKAKTELSKLGDTVTDDQISEYITEYMDEKRKDEEIFEDEYIIREADENIEIIDVGTEYGDMAQGIENAGRGINDFTYDYSSQFD